MARPKMTVTAALEKSKAVDTRKGGAKKVVKLENGRVVHMRVKKKRASETSQIHSGLEDQSTRPPVVAEGGGSSSVKLDAHEGPLPSNCAPGHVNMETESSGGKGEEYMCTACGLNVDITHVRPHPVLYVGVCLRCYDFLFSSPFTKDNPQDPDEHENECRWCGDGGEVVLCDTCPKAFCTPCITRNFGAETMHAIASSTRQWQCFACDSELLQDMVLDYESKVQKTTNPAPQRRKPKSQPKGMYDRNPGRSRPMNEITMPNATIAAMIAQQKENLQRENPGKWFNGFEITIKRPQKSSVQYFIDEMNGRIPKRKRGTSKKGERSTSPIEFH